MPLFGGNFGMFPGSIATGMMQGQANAQEMADRAIKQRMAAAQLAEYTSALNREQQQRRFGGQTLYGLLDMYGNNQPPAPMPGTPSVSASAPQQGQAPQGAPPPVADRGYGYGLAQMPLANQPIPGVPLSGPASGLPAYMDPALRQVMPGGGDPSKAPAINGVPLYRPVTSLGSPPEPVISGGMVESPEVGVSATVPERIQQDPMLIRFLRAARSAGVPAEALPDMVAKFNPIMANEIREVQNQSLSDYRERRVDVEEGKLGVLERAEYRRGEQGQERIDLLAKKLGDQNAIMREANRIRAMQVGKPMNERELEFAADAFNAGINPATILGRSQVRRDQFSDYMAKRGEGAAEVASKRMAAGAESAGQRALSMVGAKQSVAYGLMEKTLPLILEASSKSKRTKFNDFNNILMSGERRTGDKDVVQLGVYLNTLINQYSRAVSPTGTPTVWDKKHAREMLEIGFSEGQLKAAIESLMNEVKAESTTVTEVQAKRRKSFVDSQKSGGAAQPAAGAQPGFAPPRTVASRPATAKEGSYFEDNGTWSKFSGGKWVENVPPPPGLK